MELTNSPEDAALIEEAGAMIRKGGVVAFPTETVYGLGGDALNRDAARKIYAAKGRPSDNPLIVHIADIRDLEQIAEKIPEAARKLAGKYWPGPLTMIFDKKEIVPDETTGGRKTVAVRFPDQETARRLIRAAGGFICAPSANISGKPSPTNGRDVLEDMNGRIDAIIDDGESVIGLESTIVDMTCDPPELLRPGAVTPAMLRECVPELRIDPALTGQASAPSDSDTEEGGKGSAGAQGCSREPDRGPRAPGMKYRHYAPKAPLYLFGETAQIRKLSEEARRQGKKVGILTSLEHAGRYEADCVKVLGGETDEAEMAHNLFRCLREFDREEVDVIYSETFDESGIGFALMNRLRKAANAKGETHVES